MNNLTDHYTIEYINDIDVANKRLWHNSYDILLLDEKFSKKYTIDLSKMSFAMSRPSIVLCRNFFTLLSYKLWKALSKFTHRFTTSKQLIFFIDNNNKDLILRLIKTLSHKSQLFYLVTKEICNNC